MEFRDANSEHEVSQFTASNFTSTYWHLSSLLLFLRGFCALEMSCLTGLRSNDASAAGSEALVPPRLLMRSRSTSFAITFALGTHTLRKCERSSYVSASTSPKRRREVSI